MPAPATTPTLSGHAAARHATAAIALNARCRMKSPMEKPDSTEKTRSAPASAYAAKAVHPALRVTRACYVLTCPHTRTTSVLPDCRPRLLKPQQPLLERERAVAAWPYTFARGKDFARTALR